MAGTSPKSTTSWHSEEETELDLEEIEVALYGMLHHATPADDADFSLPLAKSSTSHVLSSSPSHANVENLVSSLPSHHSSSQRKAPTNGDIQQLPAEQASGFFFDVNRPTPSASSVQEVNRTESLEAGISIQPAVRQAIEKRPESKKEKPSSNSSSVFDPVRSTNTKPVAKPGEKDRGSSSEEDSKYVAISQSLKSKAKTSAPEPLVYEGIVSPESSECEFIVEDRQGASAAVQIVDLIETSEDSEIELIELRNGGLSSKKVEKRQLSPDRRESPSTSKKAKVQPEFAPPALTSTPALGVTKRLPAVRQSRVVLDEETVVSAEEDLVLNIKTPRRKNRPPAASEIDQIISDSFTDIEPINYETFACKKWTQAMRDFYDYSGKDPDLDEMYRQLPEHGWRLSDDDRYGLYKHSQRNRYFRGKLLRCANCHQPDHITRRCPEPIKPRVCHRCGEQGHTEYLCYKKMCLQCATVLGAFTESCHNCLEFKFITCSICGLKGHPIALCPDTWRRYHITTNAGPLTQLPLDRANKPLSILYCSNCTKCGHLAYQCPAYRNSPYPRYFPYIASYDSPQNEETTTVYNATVPNTTHSKTDRFEALLREWGPSLKFHYKFKFPYASDSKSLPDIHASKKRIEDDFPNVAAVLQLSKKNDNAHLVEFWGTSEPACLKARKLFKKMLREFRKTKNSVNHFTPPTADSHVNESVEEHENQTNYHNEPSFQFKSHCPYKFTFPCDPDAVAYVENCKKEVEKAYPAVSISVKPPFKSQQYVTGIRGLSNQFCNKAKDYFQKLIEEYTPTNTAGETSHAPGPSNTSTKEFGSSAKVNSEASTSGRKSFLGIEPETSNFSIVEPNNIETTGDESRVASDSEDVSVAENLPSTSNTSFNTLVAGLSPYLESNCKMYLPLNNMPLERLSALKSKVEEAVGHLAVTVNTIGLKAHKVIVKFWGRECWRGKQLFKMWFNEEVEAHTTKRLKEPNAPAVAQKSSSPSATVQKKNKQWKKPGERSRVTGEEEEQVVQGRIQEFVQNLGPNVQMKGKFSVHAKKYPLEFLEKIRVAVENQVGGVAVVVRKTQLKIWIEFYGNGDTRGASRLFKKLVFATPNGELDKPEGFTQQRRVRLSYTDKSGRDHVFSRKIDLSPESQKEFLDMAKDLEGTYEVSVAVNCEPTVLTLCLKGRRSNEAFKHLTKVIKFAKTKR